MLWMKSGLLGICLTQPSGNQSHWQARMVMGDGWWVMGRGWWSWVIGDGSWYMGDENALALMRIACLTQPRDNPSRWQGRMIWLPCCSFYSPCAQINLIKILISSLGNVLPPPIEFESKNVSPLWPSEPRGCQGLAQATLRIPHHSSDLPPFQFVSSQVEHFLKSNNFYVSMQLNGEKLLHTLWGITNVGNFKNHILILPLSTNTSWTSGTVLLSHLHTITSKSMNQSCYRRIEWKPQWANYNVTHLHDGDNWYKQ